MKKNIILIIVLMSTCVAGIICLQLFWNYQNYKSTVKTFNHDINEALRAAVDREIDLRHQIIVKKFANWMRDTSFITITCDIKNRDHKTVFNVIDTRRYPQGDKGFSLSINGFKPQLTKITPEAKAFFISHFSKNIVKSDLKKGSIYYYTQRLGDSLQYAFFTSRRNDVLLNRLYQEELEKRDIHASFILSSLPNKSKPFNTVSANTSLRRPYEKDYIRAGFDSPDIYFLKEMKWIVITSMLLIAITLICFAYTARTLLSQQKLAELTDNFINNMTHELNTPLASIKITAEALKSFNHKPETQKEYLDIIDFQTNKLTDLTTRILNTNRLIKITKDTWTSVDVHNLIQDAVQTLSPQCNTCNAFINYHPHHTDLKVKGEISSLLSAFVNIIDNALKYNTSATMRLNIDLQTENNYVEITFADNGTGIPQEYQKQVFEQFFRVPQGNIHNVKGYGLGLSYVKQVIKHHNGFIKVSDNEPSGSVFTIRLPLL